MTRWRWTRFDTGLVVVALAITGLVYGFRGVLVMLALAGVCAIADVIERGHHQKEDRR